MTECAFCQIVKEEQPCHKIWENDEFLAFLSIFPNTYGFTILISKNHYSSDAFSLPDEIYTKLLLAAKKVGKLLESKLDDVGRVGLILEGYGVDHAHAKLFPMHGTAKLKKWEPLTAFVDKYFHEYEGYISSHDFQRAEEKDLDKLVRKIRKT